MSELATMAAVQTRMATNVVRPRAMTMVLEGELGREELSEIGEMLVRLSMDGVTHLVIDFQGVTHLDFRGLATLKRRAEVFRCVGGDVKLSGLSPYLFAIFQAAGVQDAFDFFAEAQDAHAAFRGAVMVQRL